MGRDITEGQGVNWWYVEVIIQRQKVRKGYKRADEHLPFWRAMRRLRSDEGFGSC